MPEKQLLTCPSNSRYSVELDPAEVNVEDPGQGTPAMVYGPGGASGTFYTVLDNCEIGGSGDDYKAVPQDVMDWLEEIEEQVTDFINRVIDEAQAAKPSSGPRL